MNALLELIREFDVVEEHPGIMILVVESILKLPDALHRSVDLLIPAKHHKDRISFSELRVGGFYINQDGFCLFLFVLATEQGRYRRFFAIRFVREAEDRMEADLWDGGQTGSRPGRRRSEGDVRG